jgi:hypothetical protein
MEKEREPLDETLEQPTCTDDMEDPPPAEKPVNDGGGTAEVPGNVTTLSDF